MNDIEFQTFQKDLIGRTRDIIKKDVMKDNYCPGFVPCPEGFVPCPEELIVNPIFAKEVQKDDF